MLEITKQHRWNPGYLKNFRFFGGKKVDFMIFHVMWRLGPYQKTDLARPLPLVSRCIPQSAIYVSVCIQKINTDDI